MLYQVMKHIRNFFPAGEAKKSAYVISDGSISLPLLSGQYFLIEGSILNDGVYQYPCNELQDETFVGFITPLAIPKDFLKVVEEIEAYVDTVHLSPYTSESFGGYSYTKATGRNGNVAGWTDIFASQLNTWRKI